MSKGKILYQENMIAHEVIGIFANRKFGVNEAFDDRSSDPV